MQLYLEVVEWPGDPPRRLFPLAVGQALVIGRGGWPPNRIGPHPEVASIADILVPCLAVHRRQCEVGRDACGAWARDLHTAHTLVNGRRIGPGAHQLRPGDEIRVARARLRLGLAAPDPSRPGWGRGVVAGLARRIREEGDFAAMPVLADALEEAGCTDDEILGHLRGPGPHVRGCWPLDLLLGRE